MDPLRRADKTRLQPFNSDNGDGHELTDPPHYERKMSVPAVEIPVTN